MTLKTTFFHAVLIFLPFVILEGAFRLLPVSDPPHLLAVSSDNPVARYEPNLDYRYSSGWNFSIRANKRSNNYGYINPSDYHPEEATPLLMVVGDSYVESHSIDAGKSAAEILNRAVQGKGRVYSIGLSGAPLSQYLVFAEFSAATFRPNAMVFVIIENDFDESLLKYNADPRFHYFEEHGDQFTLRRVDYEISPVKKILRSSAFVRYVWWNLQGGALRQNLQRFFCRAEDAEACSGKTPAALDQRVEDSKRAVDYFLDQLPIKTKLDSKSMVFVLDAIRPAMYSSEALLKAENGYVSRMRRYFMQQASSRGYEVIDMQPAFIRQHRLDNSRFEFPTDAHWNALGNALVAEEIRNSALFTRVFDPDGLMFAGVK
jgi:hypothetical protein